jgi:hypothetical protein
MNQHDDDQRCDYCGEIGCHWRRHPQAVADVEEWQREQRRMTFPFGDHTHDAEIPA